jgi:hypothetical protein
MRQIEDGNRVEKWLEKMWVVMTLQRAEAPKKGKNKSSKNN